MGLRMKSDRIKRESDMIESITISSDTQGTINMSNMQPYDIGVVVNSKGMYNGVYVMRSASLNRMEVFALTDPKPDRCWGKSSSLRVRLLESGDTVTLQIK